MSDAFTPARADPREPIPPRLAAQLAELRKYPGQWFRVMGWDDPGTARAVAEFLGTHPDARGFAFGVRGTVLVGSYYGEAPAGRVGG